MKNEWLEWVKGRQMMALSLLPAVSFATKTLKTSGLIFLLLCTSKAVLANPLLGLTEDGLKGLLPQLNCADNKSDFPGDRICAATEINIFSKNSVASFLLKNNKSQSAIITGDETNINKVWSQAQNLELSPLAQTNRAIKFEKDGVNLYRITLEDGLWAIVITQDYLMKERLDSEFKLVADSTNLSAPHILRGTPAEQNASRDQQDSSLQNQKNKNKPIAENIDTNRKQDQISSTATAQTDSLKAEERTIPPRDGASATVFGLLLGHDRVAEVASKVQHQEGSICRISRSQKECRPTYEDKTLGYLDNRGKSVAIGKYVGISPSDANVLFAKFSVDGEYLTGTFFRDTLVAISVTGRYSDDLDSNVDVKALMASFDKKYKKQPPPFVRTETNNGITDKYTYHVWKDTAGAFDIQLTRHDSLLINKVACLQLLKTLLSVSADLYASAKHRCEGSLVHHKLDYRAPELYKQAFDHARQLEATAEALKTQAATKRIDKY